MAYNKLKPPAQGDKISMKEDGSLVVPNSRLVEAAVHRIDREQAPGGTGR